MRRIATIFTVLIVGMLVLASCGSSIADTQDDVKAAFDDVGITLDDTQAGNIDDWTECMLGEVGLKNMRNAFSPDGDPSEVDEDRMDAGDEFCVKNLGLDPDEPWNKA